MNLPRAGEEVIESGPVETDPVKGLIPVGDGPY